MNQQPHDWADALAGHIANLIKNPTNASAQISIPTMLRQMQSRVDSLEQEVMRLKQEHRPG